MAKISMPNIKIKRKKDMLKHKADDKVKEPIVAGFEIPATRTSTLKQISEVISQVPYLDVVLERNEVIIINIESRDLDKKPYLFSMIYLEKNIIRVLYTVTPGMSPRKRRIDILRYFFTIVSMLSKNYNIKIVDIYQLLEDAIDKISEYVTLDYEEMYSKYDSIKSENERIIIDLTRLRETNRELAKENYELKTKIDSLKLKLEKVSSYTDESLKIKIIEWIKEHSGEINIPEFSKMFGIPETKTEDILNLLIRQGYLESSN